MNYTYDELRSRISILDFAQAHGYTINLKKELRWPVLEHGSWDKIIIINPRDSQNQGYFNPNQDRDKGTLIQFVTNRLGWLFQHDQSQSLACNFNQVLHQWLNMPFRERLYQSNLLLLSKHGDQV
jgi:hypothetical protein